MNDEIREQISALADDELSDVERPLLLSRLERDPQLAAFLGRYRLIGEVMRGGGDAATLGIAERVQSILAEDETDVQAVARGPLPARWAKPAAGLAVAASVAMVAVLSVNALRSPGPEAVPALAKADPSADVRDRAAAPVLAQAASAPGEQWDRLDPSIDKRLAGYLVNHNEYAASHGTQGVVPYVRIVGFDQ
jgi:sigma-E factor negative regulatory protein RseA